MATHAEWNKHTGATEVANAFAEHIKGRTVLISGVSPESIGAAVAKAIASGHPSKLILASRTASNLAAVADEIHAAFPDVVCKNVTLDLSSFASVRSAIPQIEAALGTNVGLDVLINNAAVNVREHEFTKDGHEKQWQTNHLGPFLLTNLLLPRLGAAKAGACVVNVSSDGHFLCPIRFSDPEFRRPMESLPASEKLSVRRIGKLLPKEGQTYSPFLAYAQSKTANTLVAVHMSRMYGEQGIVAFSVHPGTIETKLSRDLDEGMTKLLKSSVREWKTLDQGAATILVAAFDPKLVGANGAYLSDCQIAKCAPHASDVAAAERLWHYSERQTQQIQSVL